MFANVTLQDILSTLQAPPPEMQAAPGFAELLQFSERDWGQWLEKLQQLDEHGQDLAALPADFPLLPESELDRAAVDGLSFLNLPDSKGQASETVQPPQGGQPPSAMAMLAALLYQPDLSHQKPVMNPAQVNPEEALQAVNPGMNLARGGQVRTDLEAVDRVQAQGAQARPQINPFGLLQPGLGVMGGLAAPVVSEAMEAEQMLSSLPVQKDLDTPQLAQNLQSRQHWLQNSLPASAQPTPVLQPHAPAFAQQMQQQIQFMLRQDMKQMEVRLDPPELGAMKIHLKLEHGLTHVQIITSTPEARDLLDAGQMRLREAMPQQQAGLQLDIRHQPGGFQGQMGGQTGDQPPSRDAAAAAGNEMNLDTSSEHATAQTGWQTASIENGRVDTFI